MIARNVKLIDVIQVMLVRWILPCQRRGRPLWDFNPKKHLTLVRLFETTHEDAWKLLFKGNEKPPPRIQTVVTTINTPPARYVTFDVSPT